ncbi:hypothetical protein [Salinarimonas soli]|uniref:Uncharacterized protein n=1 Tax=Salinarimonas soli TaxID=1638099 RepID=A0A5B2VUY8_9HYPH|nr:hypothetical protein [Salinarimonas soli]KAA2242132.1 hypothetical protein F0L46_03985 [Salinarimonas soli]
MSNGPASFTFLSLPFNAPLSGAVTQAIAPAVYKGVPEIEADIVREAASFGRQLGIVSEAVAALAERLDRRAASEEPLSLGPVSADERVDALRTLVVGVDRIKTRNKTAMRAEAQRAMERLREVDGDGYDFVLRNLVR